MGRVCNTMLAHLHVAFCDVERSNGCVGKTAGDGTTKHALGIVRDIVWNGASISIGDPPGKY